MWYSSKKYLTKYSINGMMEEIDEYLLCSTASWEDEDKLAASQCVVVMAIEKDNGKEQKEKERIETQLCKSRYVEYGNKKVLKRKKVRKKRLQNIDQSHVKEIEPIQKKSKSVIAQGSSNLDVDKEASTPQEACCDHVNLESKINYILDNMVTKDQLQLQLERHNDALMHRLSEFFDTLQNHFSSTENSNHEFGEVEEDSEPPSVVIIPDEDVAPSTILHMPSSPPPPIQMTTVHPQQPTKPTLFSLLHQGPTVVGPAKRTVVLQKATMPTFQPPKATMPTFQPPKATMPSFQPPKATFTIPKTIFSTPKTLVSHKPTFVSPKPKLNGPSFVSPKPTFIPPKPTFTSQKETFFPPKPSLIFSKPTHQPSKAPKPTVPPGSSQKPTYVLLKHGEKKAPGKKMETSLKQSPYAINNVNDRSSKASPECSRLLQYRPAPSAPNVYTSSKCPIPFRSTNSAMCRATFSDSQQISIQGQTYFIFKQSMQADHFFINNRQISIIPLIQESLNRGNFAVKLIRELFRDEELNNRNVYGTQMGKKALDSQRINFIKTLAFQYYPAEDPQRDTFWARAVNQINDMLRHRKRSRLSDVSSSSDGTASK